MRTIIVPIALTLALLAGRVAAQGEVRTFNKLDSAPKKFALVSTRVQDASQQGVYARLLRNQLRARGWKETAFAAADVAVFVQYQVSDTRNEALKHPTRSSPVSVDGVTAATATLTSRTLGATAAQSAHSRPERTLRIEMFAARPYMRDMTMVPVYDSIVRATAGASATPEASVTELLKVALEQLPGEFRTLGSEAIAEE